MAAEWPNAVQEEIINAIVAAGLTPATDSAADRAAGWDQLKTAIFDSAAILDAGIGSLDLSKVFGFLNILQTAGGITDNWAGSVYLHKIEHLDPGSSLTQRIAHTATLLEIFESSSLVTEKVEVRKDSVQVSRAELGNSGFTEITPDGIRYEAGKDPFNCTVIDLSDRLLWTNTGSHVWRMDHKETNILKTRKIYGSNFIFTQSTDGWDAGGGGPSDPYGALRYRERKSFINETFFNSVQSLENWDLVLITEDSADITNIIADGTEYPDLLLQVWHS